MDKKALIIGIDGCRPDSLLAAKTPTIDSLKARGAYSFKAQACRFTKSGPCWTSMLTGTWPEKHGVVNNSFEGFKPESYPHFFQRLKEAKPGVRTASIVHWAPINTHLVRGADIVGTYPTDDEVVTAVSRVLTTDNVDALYLHFDDADGAGHKNGYGPNQAYLDMLAVIDSRIASILKALKSRKSYSKENWLVLVSTDHGGETEKAPGAVKARHGDDVPEQRTIFVIVSGNAAKKGEILPAPNSVDVPQTVLSHLGVAVRPEWGWDGRPVGLQGTR